MPITDPSLPARFLDAVQGSGVEFAVLHREEEIGTDRLEGDLDLTVGMEPDDLLRLIRPALAAANLHPVIRWPYDIGGTVAFFLATDTGEHGLQVDLLHDPRGVGRYGVRSDELLAGAVPGKVYPVPHPLDQRLYLISKRFRKGDAGAVAAELRALVDLGGPASAIDRARQLFEPRTADLVIALIQGEAPRHRPAPFRAGQIMRRVSRLRYHVGYWAHIEGPTDGTTLLVDQLSTRFRPWLPRTETGVVPDGIRRYLWRATRVAATTVRPAIFLSHGDLLGLEPDLDLAWEPGADVEVVARSIITGMTGRLDT